MSWDKYITIRCDMNDCSEHIATGKTHAASARLVAGGSKWCLARIDKKMHDICPKCIDKLVAGDIELDSDIELYLNIHI